MVHSVELFKNMYSQKLLALLEPQMVAAANTDCSRLASLQLTPSFSVTEEYKLITAKRSVSVFRNDNANK